MHKEHEKNAPNGEKEDKILTRKIFINSRRFQRYCVRTLKLFPSEEYKIEQTCCFRIECIVFDKLRGIYTC